MSLGKSAAADSSSATPPEPTPAGRDEEIQLGPEALKAYAHPLRMAILRYLQDHGAATSTTLAQHLGESTGQTSYHLRQLAKHRLIEDVPGRGSGRERWWRARSANVDLATMLTDEATAHAANVLLNEVLRERTETLARWMSSLSTLDLEGLGDEEVAKRSLHSQATLMLTPTELGEMNEQLAEIVSQFADRYRHRFDEGAPANAARVRAYIDVFPLVAPQDNSGHPDAPEV